MKGKVCLHGVGIKHQSQLLGQLKRLLPSAAVKYKVKEKYFHDNDMYKCRLARFRPKGKAYLRATCAWGTLVVCDKLLPVADITVEFDCKDAASVAAADELLTRLLNGKVQYVVEEPDLSLRIDSLRGCFWPANVETYDASDAGTALVCHLPWQVYGISRLWEQVLAQGGERQQWRQLRVKLRRLRSSLVLLKPLLPTGEATVWQQALKNRAATLSAVREYDVLLQNCARLRFAPGAGCDDQQEAVPCLAAILRDLRQQELDKAFASLKLNKLTLELARFLLWLQQEAVAQDVSMKDFFRKRLNSWAEKLKEAPEKSPNMRDMVQLHRLRIKLKRFRYALQSVPEIATSARLLRSLKYLQDALGVLHDDYVNGQLLEQLVQEHSEVEELRYEAAMLSGWEQARADVAMEQLPNQWEEFCILLEEWQQEL